MFASTSYFFVPSLRNCALDVIKLFEYFEPFAARLPPVPALGQYLHRQNEHATTDNAVDMSDKGSASVHQDNDSEEDDQECGMLSFGQKKRSRASTALMASNSKYRLSQRPKRFSGAGYRRKKMLHIGTFPLSAFSATSHSYASSLSRRVVIIPE